MTVLTRLCIGALLLILFSASAYCQSKKKFTGQIQLNSEDVADAVYGYIENKQQRVLDGDYKIEINKRDSLFDLAFSKIIWQGRYNQNKKTSDWLYIQDDHKLTINDVREFDVDYALITSRQKLEAQYEQGIKKGVWKYAEEEFKKGVNRSTLAEVQLSFDGDHLQNQFDVNAKNEQVQILGAFDNEGFPDGKWVLTYPKDSLIVTETRQYANGFLINLLKVTEQDTLDFYEYESVANRVIVLGQQADDGDFTRAKEAFDLTFDQGYLSTSKAINIQKKGNELIKDYFQKATRLDSAFESTKINYLKSARFEFRYPKGFQTKVINTLEVLDSINSILKKPQIVNFFEINSQKSDSMAWIFNYFGRYQSRLKSMKSALHYLNSNQYRYVDATLFFNQHFDFLMMKDSLLYNYDGQDKTILIDSAAVEPTIESIFSKIFADRVKISNLSIYVINEIKQTQRSNQLEQLEKTINRIKHQLDSIYAYQPDNRIKPVISALENRFLVDEFNHKKQEYANAVDYEQKMTQGYGILNFTSKLSGLPDRMQLINTKRAEIEKAYTIKKFDPYTYNYDFETKTKRKIYDKAAVELYDYLLIRLQQQATLKEADAILDTIEALQNKLLTLLAEDTRKLERKIKAQSTPKEVLSLLEISTGSID